VVDRPAIDGDLVTIDLHGNDASDAEVVGVDDYLYEVGSGTVVPELDAELHGAKAGAILAFDAANPQNADERIAFRVLVKEVKVKKLPAETDEWAAESSEFATIGELRADIEERIRRVKLVQTQMTLRQKAVEALSGLVAEDDVPEVLVDAEVNERLHDLQHRLEAQKLGLAEYFQATGTSPDELLASVRVDAHAAVKADLALRALVEAEELPLSEDELDAEVSTMAERMDTSPADLRRRLDTAGRTGAVRSELRKGKALEWLLDHVDLVDEEGNPMSRDDLKVDASGDGEGKQDEETSEDAQDG
jgi:trigger factor